MNTDATGTHSHTRAQVKIYSRYVSRNKGLIRICRYLVEVSDSQMVCTKQDQIISGGKWGCLLVRGGDS